MRSTSASGGREIELHLEKPSPEEARILVDAKVCGRGYAEIAETLSKSVAAVKQVASRSVRRLRVATKPPQPRDAPGEDTGYNHFVNRGD